MIVDLLAVATMPLRSVVSIMLTIIESPPSCLHLSVPLLPLPIVLISVMCEMKWCRSGRTLISFFIGVLLRLSLPLLCCVSKRFVLLFLPRTLGVWKL